jgi:uncharacterized protein YdeI (YjbR/CyaY-like superfamily)
VPTFETLEVRDQREWHSWLKRNHLKTQGVWLVFHRKGRGNPSPTYEKALDWALAYGWIDSLIKKLDDSRYARKFTPRKPWSIWSTPNINRVKRLNLEGKMTKWGLEAFAMRTSEKSLLEQFSDKEVEIPKDLEQALRANFKAWTNFQKFSPGYRKRYLIWISGAKKSETRRKRISEAVELISANVKALLK